MFQTNKKLEEMIGGNTIINNNVKRTTKENMNGKYLPRNGRKNTMCCRQIKTTTSIISYENKNTFKIFHNLSCKSNFLIECITKSNKSKEALQEL